MKSFKSTKNIIWFYSLITLLLTTACTGDKIVSTTTFVPDRDGWNSDTPFVFAPDTPTDSTALFDLKVLIRHTGEYRFTNLWLKIDQEKTNHSLRSDTLTITLADQKGEWIGNGWGSIYQVETLYRSGISYRELISQPLYIYQITPYNPLNGIVDISITATKH